jgi:XTP/dITP diphosphohydrolase
MIFINMNSQIIFTTTNKGKIREAKRLLKLKDIYISSLKSFNDLNVPHIPETGNTFEENARIKARAYYELLKIPVIADDSGLVVPALNNEPGVRSARYAGINASTSENNALLLRKMKLLKNSDRQAYFQSAIIYKDELNELLFEGRCYGRIAEKPKGIEGFGYDPLFFISKLNKTFAELSIREKNKISHRGMAFKALEAYLRKKK